MAIEIVLVEPEIPQNTGNIARTCVATGIKLHLIEPLGFSITEKAVKRAGLDYWFDLDITLWKNLDEFMQKNAGRNLFYATTKAAKCYADVDFPADCMILFGKETKGLPEPMLAADKSRCIRIPMLSEKRSLNLSNSVAIILYEYLRQKRFPGMQEISTYMEM
ncbi:MAG: tRNA (cytidine(34)-2'-O)-methyltransferase [Saccharofermentanales bacterium]